jgi:Tfp pilus assembly protein PilF
MIKENRNIQAAIGYLGLGMLEEANNEIECIPLDQKNSSEVLGVRLEIYRAAEKWTLMEVVARELWKRHQDQPLFWNHHAYAVRRSTGLEEAHKILSEALEKFPDDGMTNFNLGCYSCQLGDLESAKVKVGKAIKLDPQWKIHAFNDPDLEPLWEMWSQT